MTDYTIQSVRSIDIRVTSYDWPFMREARAEIDTFWKNLSAQKPHVFDGRVLLMHQHIWRDDAFHALAFETSYSAFMTWKALGFPGSGVHNFFGMAALRATDGAFLVGEMSPHTANAGQSYFPAGTPEPADLCEGFVDLEGSVLRECQEETGLSAHDLELRDVWTAIGMSGQIAFMRDVRLAENAAAAKKRLEANLATEERPEFSRFHIIAKPSDAYGLTMPSFMQPFLDHALG